DAPRPAVGTGLEGLAGGGEGGAVQGGGGAPATGEADRGAEGGAVRGGQGPPQPAAPEPAPEPERRGPQPAGLSDLAARLKATAERAKDPTAVSDADVEALV